VRELAAGELLANRYLVEAELGRGGGGVVYSAFDQGAQLRVAIKLLNAAGWSGPRSADQLYRELRFGRSIQHPNVCRIYDVFEAQGQCLLVMEYASAGTLRASLRGSGADRPLEDKLADARGVIAGLAAIHRAGLVHRDFKPENILRMADGRLVVSDFGLTRELGQATVTTHLAGTPGYLAPESLTGIKESQASDVWALGVVLHEILEGCRPEWGNPRKVAGLRSGKKVEPRHEALSALCRLCLEPDPGRRPASAITVEARLEGRNFGRSTFAGRRIWGAAAAVALGAGLVAVGLGGSWFRAAAPTAAPDPIAERAADWSRSRVIVALAGSFCLEARRPNRRMVRAVSRLPAAVVDIDAESGFFSQKPDLAEAGCLSESADGKTVLFGKEGQVMLARQLDGQDAAPVTPGANPSWLPSGRAFVFADPQQRLAIGDLQGRIQRLAAPGPAPVQIRDVAVDDRGHRAAAVAAYGEPAKETRIDLYDLRTLQLLRSRKASPRTRSVEFDPVRRSFQFSEERGGQAVWSELTEQGESRVLGRLTGQNIDAAVRVTGGFLFTATIRSTSGGLYRVGPDGAEQYISARARQFRSSPAGDLVYVNLDRADRGTIMLKRRDRPVRDLSEPDMFGDPNISADGRVVVFDHLLTGEIFRCDLTSGDDKSGCQLITVDRTLFPGQGLALDPAGGRVAYLARASSAGGASLQLRLLTVKTRQVRDLASIETTCEPACQIDWPSASTIRLCSPRRSTVVEVDVASGQKTERPATGGSPCTPQSGDHRFELRMREAVELRFVPDLVNSRT
jgi:hypothetical protein